MLVNVFKSFVFTGTFNDYVDIMPTEIADFPFVKKQIGFTVNANALLIKGNGVGQYAVYAVVFD